MPRIRTVKPAFWESEKLAKRLPGPDGRQARLLFIASWNFAEDATGVLRGSLAFLRANVFPYDEDVTTADVARWLDLLERGGFVVRFQREDQSYVWVRNFRKHQKIDKPAKTTLPEPTDEEKTRVISREAPQFDEPSPTPRLLLDESSPTPRRGFDEASTSPRRRLADDSPTDREEEEDREVGKGVEGSGEVFAAVAAPPARETPEALQNLWNTTADPSLPRWREMPKERQEAARRALRARPLCGDGGSWQSVFRALAGIPFCLGMNERGWRASPDWILKPKSAARVLEGAYGSGPGPPTRGRASEADRDWSRPIAVNEDGEAVL